MLFSILQGGDLWQAIIQLLLSLPIIIFALTVHETAHGYAAWRCGDPTAYNLGRLTLNPLKHIDPIGFFAMLIFGYGWAKPVPVNTRYFRNPKRDMALTAAAGPASNLLMATVSALLCGVLRAFYLYFAYHNPDSAFLATCIYVTMTLFELGALYNFLFMAFNLIPVPPFDGSRIAFVFLPSHLYFKIMRYERQIMLGLLLGLLLLSRLFSFSPFSWIAYSLTDLIVTPVTRGVLALLF